MTCGGDESFDHVFQLPDIAWPIQLTQARDGTVRDGHHPAGARTRGAGEVLDEQGDVLTTLAQRRHANQEDGEAEEQVLAEPAGRDVGLGIAAGGGQHACVDAHRLLRAHRAHLAFLQDAQDLRLHRRRTSR